MSIRRRIESMAGMMVIGGKVVAYTYNCEVALDSVPPPFQYPGGGPDNPGGRSPIATPTLGRFVEGSGWEATDPRPEPVKRRPTKAEFHETFAADCEHWPACVVARFEHVDGLVMDVIGHYELTLERMPRRVRRAMRRIELTLPGIYDRGTLARFEHYHARHVRRANRAVLAESHGTVR
jgi:hypothetical protein